MRGAEPRERPLEQVTDDEVLDLLARSDERALGELYNRFGGVAYGLAFRILRDEALAQDAVQDAFLAVWRSADSFLPERARPSTWILTLVHRRAVDLVRREERRRSEPLEPEMHPAGGATDEEASVRYHRRLVQEALKRLPAEQREAIELAYYGGLSQSEVAERLGQPLGTIKSRTFAGLTRLRDLLREAGVEEPIAH
ncbi:MAG: sigma-70 family RNA polymerase sigma factor [Gaiellaceae bacterium]